MSRPLMPKATALWLMRHTSLTLEQIARFCQVHPLEMDVLASGHSLYEANPILTGQLTQEEIDRCQADSSAELTLSTPAFLSKKQKKAYTPLSKRADIPHAIFWCIKNHPLLTDAQICSLISTTKTMVHNIREGTYWNIKALTPKDPVLLGLCTEENFQKVLEKAQKALDSAQG